MSPPEQRESALHRFPRPMLGGVIAIAVAVGFIVWLATKSDGNSSTQPPTPAVTTTTPARPASAAKATPVGPIVLSVPALRALAGSLEQPVYWIGPEPGRRTELTRAAAGNVFVRYLPVSVKAGDKRAFLTIGTYPFKGAYAATTGLSKQPGSISRKLPGGWLAVYSRARPTNIYLARPGFDYQVEVFDPSPAKARGVVESNRLRQVR